MAPKRGPSVVLSDPMGHQAPQDWQRASTGWGNAAKTPSPPLPCPRRQRSAGAAGEARGREARRTNPTSRLVRWPQTDPHKSRTPSRRPLARGVGSPSQRSAPGTAAHALDPMEHANSILGPKGKRAKATQGPPAEGLKLGPELRPPLGLLGDRRVDHHVGQRHVQVARQEEQGGRVVPDHARRREREDGVGSHADGAANHHVRRTVIPVDGQRVGHEAREAPHLRRVEPNAVEQIVAACRAVEPVANTLVAPVLQADGSNVPPAEGARQAGEVALLLRHRAGEGYKQATADSGPSFESSV
eukprot:scaffold32617_cov126-Isochrysis_galbana.AAC.2